MKKTLVVFLSVQLCCSVSLAVDYNCMNEEGHKAHDYYFNTNYDKQIGTEEFRSLNAQKQREAKTRNLCFGASLSWHTFCAWSKCADTKKQILGHTLQEYCEWSNIDCFSADIEKIVSALQDSNDAIYEMVFTDMNKVTNNIANDKAQLGIIDTDNSVCYRTDDNGNTIWHAFSINHKDPDSWISLCASLLKDTEFKQLSDAVYKTKNKNGKTALQETIEWNKNTRLLSILSEVYGEKGGRKACDELASDISTTNSIDISQAKSLIHSCYIFADRK